MASRNLHKSSKFGELPGDIPRRSKIRVLEKKQEFFVWPWQKLGFKFISTFRNDHYKRANRRFRRASKNLTSSD